MSNELRERLNELSSETLDIARELSGYLLTDESEGNIHHHLGVILAAINLTISCIEVSKKIVVHVTYKPDCDEEELEAETFCTTVEEKHNDFAKWIIAKKEKYPLMRVILTEEEEV